ncbi:MAG: hypothetical protein WC204_11960, partial [Elusimicrobiales bacterium]
MKTKYPLFLSLLFVFMPFGYSTVTDSAEQLLVPAGETYTLGGVHSYSAEVRIDGVLSAAGYSGVPGGGALELFAPKIYVSSSGRITADLLGYGPDLGPGRPAALTGCSKGAGAGYGGTGGGSAASKGGGIYGELLAPAELGSGGGSGQCGGASGGAGGGALNLVATELELYGIISST